MARDIQHYTTTYLTLPFEEKLVHFRKQQILKTYHQHPPQKILEIGCGMDPFFTSVHDFERYVVIEPSEHFLEHAKQLTVSPNLHFIADFFENQVDALKPEAFDFIIISGLLNELENPIDFLESVKKIAHPHTLIHINVANAHSFHRLLGYQMGLMDSPYAFSSNNITLQQHYVFDLEQLSALVTNLGFVIKEKGSYFIKPFTHIQMQQMLDQQIIDDQVLLGLDKMIEYMPNLGAEIYVNVTLPD